MTRMDRPDDAMIVQAALLLGQDFSDAERAQMADGLARQRTRALSRRAIVLPDTLLPATIFDPRPPGFVMPAPETVSSAEADPGHCPSDDEALAHAACWRQARWLATGALTATRLTGLYLARIERHDDALLSFARTTNAAAISHAEGLDAFFQSEGRTVGPLHGLAYGMKDIVDTAGVVTDWGAEPYRGRMPATDAHITTLLADAGAILLGKTTVGALAYGDLWYGGRTRNPWDTAQGSSGSSAGSASCVAAGLASFAIGTETLGSIVSPATRCRIVGLRPTFGRVSRSGVMSLCPSLDKIGVMARASADAALVLETLVGADERDPAQIPLRFSAAPPDRARGLRLGYRDEDLAPGSLELLAPFAAPLGLELVALPPRPALPYDALIAILDAEAAASFEDLTATNRDDELTWQDEAAWPNAFRRARFLSAVDHVQLDRFRRLVMQDASADWNRADAIVASPGVGPHEVITNFAGIPAVALPGFGADRLATLVLYAGLFEEARLLALAGGFERVRGSLPWPDLLKVPFTGRPISPVPN